MTRSSANLEQMLQLALQHHAAGRLSSAERLYRQTLQLRPNHAIALENCGLLAHQTGRHDAAVRFIRKAIAEGGGNAGSHYNLGLALQGLGRLDEAVASYTTALRLRPDLAEALYNRGTALRLLDRFPAAAADFGRAATLSPAFAEAHVNLALALIALGRPEEAVAAYRSALALRPQVAELHNGLGTALSDLGRLDEAIRAYRQAIALKPDALDAWFNLHSALYGDDLEPAAQCLETALKIAPDHVLSRFFLGVLRDHQGCLDAAQGHFSALPEDSELPAWGLESWHYIKSINPRPRLIGETSKGLSLGLAAARREGLVLEFGVRFGTTLNQIASHAGQPVHGFDTFHGLPEAWHEFPVGSYSTSGELPPVASNAQLHPGLFSETIPPFLEAHAEPARFLNIDCDLYSSTKTVLDLMAPRIKPGTVIVFDEYLFTRHWREGEFKAFHEAVIAHGWRYEYLAAGLLTKQAVVIIR